MTETEKTERAKMYIDKLANGINPLDNTAVADTDIVNNVRISRCLFYVSDLLGQMLESGGTPKKKKAKKATFFLELEQRDRFEFSDTPIPISEINRRINSLVDTEIIKPLKYRSITSWLIEINMLCEETTQTGRNVKRPTDSGNELGIDVEKRINEYGPYFVVLYNRNAQKFIIDNIDIIIEINNR